MMAIGTINSIITRLLVCCLFLAATLKVHAQSPVKEIFPEKFAGFSGDLGLVSNYLFRGISYSDDRPEYELHAWVEAYIPGAGWIGMDPGHGIVTNANHIPVAASSLYENTMPVTGTIRGSATSKLENTIEISRLPG